MDVTAANKVCQRASLNFDCVDQRSAVGARTTRCDYTASQIFFS